MGNAESTISIKIVSQVAQTNFGSGSYDSNATQDHIPGTLCLNNKDMFNSGSNPRSRPVTLLFPLRELAVTGAFTLNMFPVTIVLQILYCILRAIWRIRPNIFAVIVWIKQFFENITVVNIGTGYSVLSDQFMLHINRNMILVSEEINFSRNP
jgi:hypothetical protein